MSALRRRVSIAALAAVALAATASAYAEGGRVQITGAVVVATCAPEVEVRQGERASASCPGTDAPVRVTKDVIGDEEKSQLLSYYRDAVHAYGRDGPAEVVTVTFR